MDVWLTKEQVQEIANGDHESDALTASRILESWPSGSFYTEATYDGTVVRFRRSVEGQWTREVYL